MSSHTSKQGHHGIKRLYLASLNSWKGFVFAWRNESAIREELVAIAVLTPVALWLADSGVEAALLIGVLGLVLITELLNSAVEATIDHFDEHHVLFGAAKDMGSAAVFTAVVLAVITWALILL